MRVLAHLSEWSAAIWPLIFDHLFQATIFAALALAAAALLARGPARARHWVWMLASTKIALPSFVLLALVNSVGLDSSTVLRAVEPPQAVLDVSRALDRYTAPLGSAPQVMSSAALNRSDHRPIYTLLTLVWGAGVVAVAGLWWSRRRGVAKALKSGIVLDGGREVEALGRARQRARTGRWTRLMIAPGAAQPGVRGVLRSLVVLPTGIADRLTDDELDAVFLHELAHVRRWDNLTSNLHMALCCLFWFYPVVWIIDRKLLVERERVCDDEVVRLAGGPGVYVSSLLKTSRFCIGRRIAGVSAAADAGLRGRVERIVARRAPSKLNAMHRAIVSMVIAALSVFLAGGLLGRDPAAAIALTQESLRGVPAIVGDTPAPAFTPSPHDDGLVDGSDGRTLGAVAVAVDRARPVGIDFEVPGAPEPSPPASAPAAPASREPASPQSAPRPSTFSSSASGLSESRGLAPHGSSASGSQETPAPAPAATPRAYSDASTGAPTAQPPTPPPDATQPAPPRAAPAARFFPTGPTPMPFAGGSPSSDGSRPENTADKVFFPAGFENPAGIPLVILDAWTQADSRVKPLGTSAVEPELAVTQLPVVMFVNTTSRRITRLKLRFKACARSHAVSALRTDIAPRGLYVFRSPFLVDGDPRRMRVQVLGIGFDDGSVWGEFDTTIDARAPTILVPGTGGRS